MYTFINKYSLLCFRFIQYVFFKFPWNNVHIKPISYGNKIVGSSVSENRLTRSLVYNLLSSTRAGHYIKDGKKCTLAKKLSLPIPNLFRLMIR